MPIPKYDTKAFTKALNNTSSTTTTTETKKELDTVTNFLLNTDAKKDISAKMNSLVTSITKALNDSIKFEEEIKETPKRVFKNGKPDGFIEEIEKDSKDIKGKDIKVAYYKYKVTPEFKVADIKALMKEVW